MKKGVGKIWTLAFLGLAACSNAKEQLGLNKKSPDEFAVVKRAPLAMPPDYSLRPPMPGAPRPQEQSPELQAKEAVFGQVDPVKTATLTSGENVFLQEASGGHIDPQIRAKVDSETALDVNKNKPVVKKLLNLTGAAEDEPGIIVDAPKEAQRIQKNLEAGKSVTEGETPSVEE